MVNSPNCVIAASARKRMGNPVMMLTYSVNASWWEVGSLLNHLFKDRSKGFEIGDTPALMWNPSPLRANFRVVSGTKSSFALGWKVSGYWRHMIGSAWRED